MSIRSVGIRSSDTLLIFFCPRSPNCWCRCIKYNPGGYNDKSLLYPENVNSVVATKVTIWIITTIAQLSKCRIRLDRIPLERKRRGLCRPVTPTLLRLCFLLQQVFPSPHTIFAIQFATFMPLRAPLHKSNSYSILYNCIRMMIYSKEHFEFVM